MGPNEGAALGLIRSLFLKVSDLEGTVPAPAEHKELMAALLCAALDFPTQSSLENVKSSAIILSGTCIQGRAKGLQL